MSQLVIRRGLEEPDTSGAFVPHRPARPAKVEGGKPFTLVSEYQPAGDQPTAIAELTEGIGNGAFGRIVAAVGGPTNDAGKFRPHSLVRSPGLLPRCVRTYRGRPIRFQAALRHAVPVRAPAQPSKSKLDLEALGRMRRAGCASEHPKAPLTDVRHERDGPSMQRSGRRGISSRRMVNGSSVLTRAPDPTPLICPPASPY